MLQSLSEAYEVDPIVFDETGALDPVLGVDTRLFIDPSLLKNTDVPELQGSYQRIAEYFRQVIVVVRQIGATGDRMWRQAESMLKFPEVSGLSIGYSSQGVNGSGMGPGLRARLLATVRQIVAAGVDDPEIFELVGAFEDGIGPDRISDMVAKLIADDLVLFTQRACAECGIPVERRWVSGLQMHAELPINPESDAPVILVPRSVLRDLPIALDYGDIRWISEHNEELRDRLNELIGDVWREATVAQQKEALRNAFIQQPDVLRSVLDAYRAGVAEPYDFEADPTGETQWYRGSKAAAASAPLELQLPAAPTANEVFKVVEDICLKFKTLIEENQLAELLYNADGSSKHESASQLLFFGIASAYCQANNLDLSPEANAGRGPVDFKLSSGYAGRVLVEVKLTSNTRLKHGFEVQLPIYQRAEGRAKGIFLVINNGGAGERRLRAFRDAVLAAGEHAPKVLWVDASPRPSASHAIDG